MFLAENETDRDKFATAETSGFYSEMSTVAACINCRNEKCFFRADWSMESLSPDAQQWSDNWADSLRWTATIR